MVIKAIGHVAIGSVGGRDILIKLNTKYQPRPPLDPVLRESLKREFRHEVEQLGKLINKDLSIWLK